MEKSSSCYEVSSEFEAMRELLELTVHRNPYIPKTPHPKQALFLAITARDAFFGGAAGGGKSEALLMAALQFVHVPGYAALLLRNELANQREPGALIKRSHLWLDDTDAKWSESESCWYFPAGAYLKFGHASNLKDVMTQFRSSEFQFIGVDELTLFELAVFRYLFSRLRRTEGMDVPIRMRSGSNPGGVGHAWVKRRYIDEGRTKGRYYVPSTIHDNPSLDRADYIMSLSELDPVTRRQLLEGDWNAKSTGAVFERQWFHVIPEPPAAMPTWCRAWDLAATVPEPGKEPDWTAGPRVGVMNGAWYIADMKRKQGKPYAIEQMIRQTMITDPLNTITVMEIEPGSGGKNTIDHYQRNVMVGKTFYGVAPIRGRSGVKGSNHWIGPLSSAAEAGNVYLCGGHYEQTESGRIFVPAEWIDDFLDESEAWNGDPNLKDDQLIATAMGMAELSPGGTGQHTNPEQDNERDTDEELDEIPRARRRVIEL